MTLRKKIIVGIVSGVAILPILAFFISPNFGLDLVFLNSYGLKCDFHSLLRKNEKLPAVLIEKGNIVYCRMYMCDFRFPLPADARIVLTNIEDGGFDTINGSIYVVGPDGGPVNMRAYADLLQKKQFEAAPCDGSGCPDVTNNRPDIPFTMNSGEVIHYPLFDGFGASSPKQEGGLIGVSVENHMTKIRFSYFGDY